MPEQDDNEGFLLRWSRRKRGAEEPVKAKSAVAESPATEAVEETTVASLAQQSEVVSHDESMNEGPAVGDGVAATDKAVESEVAPHDLESVDIDAMNYESDYTEFMKDGVPEALKRKALRQLWRSDPILANVDGLCDYDDDFTDAALAVDVLKTVHKVGKGYLTDDEDDAEDTDDIDELEVAEEGNASAVGSADEEPVEASGKVASAGADGTPESEVAESTDADVTEENTAEDIDNTRNMQRS